MTPSEHPHTPNPDRSTKATTTVGLHPRNRHQGRYDFARLTRACPDLSAFLVDTPGGDTSLDFSNPAAVLALNRALLKVDYGIEHWDIPDGYLCPPIPGRADYLHGLADVLAACNEGVVPRGGAIRAFDIGVGANCIYPLLGHRDYGWRFVGSEIDDTALRAASAIVAANGLEAAIELRRQPGRGHIFAGVLQGEETFDISLCNPPFHASAEDAARGTRRKWRNLGKAGVPSTSARLNFGGQGTELWCTGGEVSFLRRMIRESAGIRDRAFWFSSLVSKAENLPEVRKQLHKAGALEVRETTMAQGSKQSRFVAWTFLDAAQRKAWRTAHWADQGGAATR
jgi:23S rRNA (adenine1618-N6)-methyltransferase